MRIVYALCGIILILMVGSASGAAAPLPDPTRPADYNENVRVFQPRQTEEVEFNLTAIRIDQNSRSTIINGNLLEEGEEFDSARVLEIHPAHVVLHHKNERLIVRLYEEMNKKSTESNEHQ